MEHSAAGLIRDYLQGEKAPLVKKVEIAKEKPAVAILDGVGGTVDNTVGSTDNGMLNGAPSMSASAMYADTNVKLSVAATIQEWLETDDLDDSETLADRLFMLMVGIADANQDGELDDDEQAVLESALEAAWDYLSSKGVSEEDCSMLLNDWDDSAAMRVVDLVASKMPDGDDASDDDMDGFAFGADAQESTFDEANMKDGEKKKEEDGVAMDAVYKKTMVIRQGKKVRINKRVSGTVRLTAKQKIGIRKAQMKSHSSRATIRRLKSKTIGKRLGL